ncbi:MAG: flagellar biosynthesis protein FlhB [Phycisphaerae bacterium]|nr:flagellar biosynthesis protein FlhB [Phycisphaerae bacterium]MDW8262594.1 flagellar biosynthesis protein FlhB [Phycisphaerales bacterium]
MAEEFGEKTEAPTPRRRQEAREQGQIARSPDLTAAVVILGMLLMLQWQGTSLVQALRAVAERALAVDVLADHDPRNLVILLFEILGLLARAMLPLLLSVALAAVLINLAQVGLLINSKRLKPDLGAISPRRGIKRIFGGGNGWVQFFMNAAKVTLVGVVAFYAIRGRLGEIVTYSQMEFLSIFAAAADLVFSLILRLGVLLLLLALVDYGWQRFRTERELRMTKQQVKDDLKRMEGDPLVKQRRRQIAMQRAMQRIRSAVPTADVVVTNPTEYAVALKYDPGMTAPKVVAKGRGYVAQRIREIAVEHGIPILERPPLARALWRMVEVGQEIPEQFYAAVAEILAYVYELSGRAKAVAA